MTELRLFSASKNAASLIKSLLSVTRSYHAQLSSVTSLEIVAEGKEKLSISALLELWFSQICNLFTENKY